MKVNTKNLISDFETKYQKLAEEIQASQKKIEEESQALIGDIFADYFSKYGELVYAVHWTQGTPGFNDGDPCTFSVHDIYLSFTEDGYDDGEGDMYDYDASRARDDYLDELEKWETYEADPQTAYAAAKADYERRYSYSRNSFQTFSEYKPSSMTKAEILEKLSFLEENSDKYASAIEDFKIIKKALGHIDDHYMEMIYGDNKKITYFGPEGTLRVDEYDLGY